MPTDTVLDVESTLQRLGGDEELYLDMIGFFVEDAPTLMSELQAGLASNNAFATRKAAHALKGLVLGCGGVRAARVAHSVEDAAQAHNLEVAESFADTLAEELHALTEAINEYRR